MSNRIAGNIIFLIASIAVSLALDTRAVGAGSLPLDVHEDSGMLRALMDEAWQLRLNHDALFSASMGDGRFDGSFEPADLASLSSLGKDASGLLKRLNRIEITKLTAESLIDHDVLAYELGSIESRAGSPGVLMPGLPYFGFYAQLPRQIMSVPYKTLQDYSSYIRRLQAIPKYFEQNMQLLREGVRQRWVLPCLVMDSVKESIAAQITDPDKSAFFGPLAAIPPEFPAADRERLLAEGRKAIVEQALPSYRRLLEFFDSEYRPACRSSLGVSALRGGKQYYEDSLRQATTTKLTAKQVHELGLQRVEEIRRQILDVMAEVGFKGSLREFQETLQKNGSLHTNDPKFYLQAAAEVAKRIDAKLPSFFGTLPRSTFGIEPLSGVPGFTGAFYKPGSLAASRAGTVVLNTTSVADRPLFSLPALMLHEGAPGHHLQIMLWQELPDLHPIRRYGLDQLSNFAAREGWGLYSESLGFDMGIYQTPYEKLGRYNLQMLRACRLAIDTGIHMFGWTADQARQLLRQNTFFSDAEIEAEVLRYVMTPALNTAYMVGEIRIVQMRTEAQAVLGTQFSLREFHDEILRHGALPLDVMNAAMGRWLAEKCTGGQSADTCQRKPSR